MSKQRNRPRSEIVQSSNRRTQSTMASKNSSTRGTGKGLKLISGTRDQLIKDLQRVHKVFPTAQPDRDFYRVHGKYTDAAVKVHFSRFKDFAKTAVPEMTSEESAAKALWHIGRAIALVEEDDDKEYPNGWGKHWKDKLWAKVDELSALFDIWRLIKQMDEEEEKQVEEVPTVLPDPKILKEKQ